MPHLRLLTNTERYAATARNLFTGWCCSRNLLDNTSCFLTGWLLISSNWQPPPLSCCVCAERRAAERLSRGLSLLAESMIAWLALLLGLVAGPQTTPELLLVNLCFSCSFSFTTHTDLCHRWHFSLFWPWAEDKYLHLFIFSPWKQPVTEFGCHEEFFVL